MKSPFNFGSFVIGIACGLTAGAVLIRDDIWIALWFITLALINLYVAFRGR